MGVVLVERQEVFHLYRSTFYSDYFLFQIFSVLSDVMTDFYSFLGVEKNVTRTGLRKAWLKLSLLWHPDKNPDKSVLCTKNTQKINHAYFTLEDYGKRERYDEMMRNEEHELIKFDEEVAVGQNEPEVVIVDLCDDDDPEEYAYDEEENEGTDDENYNNDEREVEHESEEEEEREVPIFTISDTEEEEERNDDPDDNGELEEENYSVSEFEDLLRSSSDEEWEGDMDDDVFGEDLEEIEEQSIDFRCNLCGKGFRYVYRLNRHMCLMHGYYGGRSGPQKCKQCGKSFKQKANFRRHMKKVHKKNEEKDERSVNQKVPKKCGECGKEFNLKQNLARHRKKAHRKV